MYVLDNDSPKRFFTFKLEIKLLGIKLLTLESLIFPCSNHMLWGKKVNYFEALTMSAFPRTNIHNSY